MSNTVDAMMALCELHFEAMHILVENSSRDSDGDTRTAHHHSGKAEKHCAFAAGADLQHESGIDPDSGYPHAAHVLARLALARAKGREG